MSINDYRDDISRYKNKIDNYEEEIVELKRKLENLGEFKEKISRKYNDCNDIIIERRARLMSVSKYQDIRCINGYITDMDILVYGNDAANALDNIEEIIHKIDKSIESAEERIEKLKVRINNYEDEISDLYRLISQMED